MTFLKLTSAVTDGPICVNFDQVTCFEENTSDAVAINDTTLGSIIWQTDDKEIEVKETPSEIVAMLISRGVTGL